MNWLKTLKTDMESITKQAAFEYWPPIAGNSIPYYNHRFEHVRQVEREALRLIDACGGDPDIIIASVWIHDRCKPQFKASAHAKNAAIWAEECLASYGFPVEKIPAVVYAVRNHEGRKIKGLDTLEAKIVWDADKLAHFGPVFMFQALFAYTSKPICEYDGVEYSENFTSEGIISSVMKTKSSNDSHSNPDTLFYLDHSKRLFAEKCAAVDNFLDNAADFL